MRIIILYKIQLKIEIFKLEKYQKRFLFYTLAYKQYKIYNLDFKIYNFPL